MTSTKVRAYLRTHLLGLVAIFIALSGTAIAGAGEDTASSSAVTTKKFKNLKKRVVALESRLNATATGDLQGIYPNLTIRTDAVTEGKIAANAVTTGKIAANAVTDAKIAADSVGTSELKAVTVRGGTTTAVGNTAASGALVANCVVGEQALAGGGFWSDFTAAGDGLAIGDLTNGFGGAHTFLVGASNQSGASQNFTPQVFCLAP